MIELKERFGNATIGYCGTQLLPKGHPYPRLGFLKYHRTPALWAYGSDDKVCNSIGFKK